MVNTISLVGLEAFQVTVSAVAAPNFSGTISVPENSVRDSRVRVRTALQQIGVDAEQRVAITLSPENAVKHSGSFDVAVAIATLIATKKLAAAAVEGIVFLGELSLSGDIRPVRGILVALRGAIAAGFKTAVVPAANAREASYVDGIEVLVASKLARIVEHLSGGEVLDGPA